MHMQEIRDNKCLKETTASLLKLFFCSLYKQKMDMDFSSDSSSSDEDTAIGAYWDSNVSLPFTDRVSEEEV